MSELLCPNVQILHRFFILRSCNSYFIKLYSKDVGLYPLELICGDTKQDIFILQGPSVILEFRQIFNIFIKFPNNLKTSSSGLVQPPFVYNGFLAELRFIQKDKKELQTPVFDDQLKDSSDEKNASPSDTQLDEGVLTYLQGAGVVMQAANPPHSKDQLPEYFTSVFKCHAEVAEPHHSGFIKSSEPLLSGDTCTIVFRGEQRDLVMIKINTLHLRYKS